MKVLYANPERYDYLHATLIEGLASLSTVELWCLNDGNYGRAAQRCLLGNVADVRDRLGGFDLIVVGTEGKMSALPPAAASLLSASSAYSARWVLVDSGDLGSLPRAMAWSRFDAVFKRELYLESGRVTTLLSNVVQRRVRRPVEYQFRRHRLLAHPNVQCNALALPAAVSLHKRRQWRLPRSVPVYELPIGIERRLVREPHDAPKPLVTCTLAPNVVPRRQILDHLRERTGVVVRQVQSDAEMTSIDLVETGAVSAERPSDHVHNDAYLDWLHQHRASISFPGGGFDTARFWEILASGSLLISKRISLDLPVPFVEGVHYVGFDSLRELDEAIRFACSDSPEVDEIRAAGHAHAVGNYTSAAVARRLIAAVGG